MKKFSFVIFSVLLVCVFVFSGCTKANSATINDCYLLYAQTVNQYGEKDNVTKVFDMNKKFDLSSSKAYHEGINAKIEGEKGLFALLKDGNEYKSLLDAASCYYEHYNGNTTFNEIPQELNTKLYLEIEGLHNAVKNVNDRKDVLSAACARTGSFSENDSYVKEILQDYLKAYNALIGKVFGINKAFVNLAANHILIPGETTGANIDNLQECVYRATLYLGNYYYQKHLVYSNNTFSRFGVEADEEYNKLYDDFKYILTNINSLKAVEEENVNAIYESARTIINGFAIDIENYITATNILNHRTALAAGDANQVYLNYVNNFEIKVENFQNYIKNTLMA